MVKHHLYIILAIVIGFSTFLLGYSLPPFMEVGFGDGDSIETSADSDTELMKQYEDLYKAEDD